LVICLALVSVIYFPYDGGNPFYFAEGVMRMAEISDEDYYVFSHASEYFELIK